MIRQKAGEYMERAEKLKNHLADQSKKKKPNALGANGKQSGGGGGNRKCVHTIFIHFRQSASSYHVDGTYEMFLDTGRKTTRTKTWTQTPRSSVAPCRAP